MIDGGFSSRWRKTSRRRSSSMTKIFFIHLLVDLEQNIYLINWVYSQSQVSNWSRGMIPASGAGGPGFDSRIGPCFAFTLAFASHANRSGTHVIFSAELFVCAMLNKVHRPDITSKGVLKVDKIN